MNFVSFFALCPIILYCVSSFELRHKVQIKIWPPSLSLWPFGISWLFTYCMYSKQRWEVVSESVRIVKYFRMFFISSLSSFLYRYILFHVRRVLFYQIFFTALSALTVWIARIGYHQSGSKEVDRFGGAKLKLPVYELVTCLILP